MMKLSDVPPEVMAVHNQILDGGWQGHPRRRVLDDGAVVGACPDMLCVRTTPIDQEAPFAEHMSADGRAGYLVLLLVECAMCGFRDGPREVFIPKWT